MKRSFILAVMLMLVAGAYSHPVEFFVAKQVAANTLGVPDVEDITPNRYGNLYLFAAKTGKGFVIVAKDDAVVPVLGYSKEGTFDTLDIPVHVDSWLKDYDNYIATLLKEGAMAGDEVLARWKKLSGGGYKDGTDSAAVVGPLVMAKWNQRPRYNNLCPYSSTDSAYSVAGCVAIAMTQIMKYWNHPATGWGSHGYRHPTFGVISASFGNTTYDWAHMPNKLTATSNDTQINAVATLVYHAGVAVNMNYSVSASGAYVPNYGSLTRASAENALKTYFRYSSSIYSIFKSAYSESEWIRVLKHELDNRRPILYSGSDTSAGHAFVLDGYDTAMRFHVNWGWGGAYDGYYAISNLSPAASNEAGGNATYTFNLNNAAVIGIKPVTQIGTTVTVAAVSSDSTKGDIWGNGIYTAYRDTVTLVGHAKKNTIFGHWNDGSTANPRLFIANEDIHDTAYFSTIGGDTISFVNAGLYTSWQDDYTDTTEWGMRIAAPLLDTTRRLKAVGIYLNEARANYTVRIYRGYRPNARNLVATQRAYLSGEGWKTVTLATPIEVRDTTPFWVTVYNTTSNYPATAATYSGNSDGTWYKENGRWIPFDSVGNYYTWMLRSYFEPIPPRRDVTLYVNDSTMGRVSGAGRYDRDSSVTIAAVPLSRSYEFVRWNDGNTVSPRTLILTSDTSFTAYFRIKKPYYYIIALSMDEHVGTVSGGGRYRQDDTITLVANIIDSNYVFSGWSDGSTDNPYRYVVSHRDTLIAYFHRYDDTIHLTISPLDTTQGDIDIHGEPLRYNFITLTAEPKACYRFDSWSNGVTDNPYTLLLLGDTTIYPRFVYDCGGIEDSENDMYKVVCYGDKIDISTDAQSHQIEIFDVVGHRLFAVKDTRMSVVMPYSGVFMVAIDHRMVQRVVIVKH